MTLRENMMGCLLGQDFEYIGDFMDAVEIVPDPALLDGLPPVDGKEHKDGWGTAWIWKPGAPGPHPHVNDKNAVIKDITQWEAQLVIPPTEGLDWDMAKGAAQAVDRSEKMVGVMMAGGLFERTHHLMGMENALVAYLEEPECMKGLLRKIADYKIAYIKEAYKQLKPDVIFYHDDWGSKKNLFLPPAVWREMIKPLQKEISDEIHKYGMLYIHHADCICEPIVLDMVELRIDLWQGTIAQNDIVRIQKITGNQLPMCGGIDGPKLDVEFTTEEQARAEVRRAIETYCKAGKFFPCVPNGECFIKRINDWVLDELDRYGHEYRQTHRS